MSILQERYSVDYLNEILLPRDSWKLFPEASERASLEKLMCSSLNKRRRAYIIGCAESGMGVPWPDLPATLFMDFSRTGNRVNYEIPYFERRWRLETAVLAELFEGSGRFLDYIIDGIWRICEETTWSLPAHCKTSRANDPLPLLSMEHVDLFACDTARLLAETSDLLGNELNAVSPAVINRIRTQTFARVLDPVTEHADIYGFSSSSNWNSWRTANILLAALVHLDNPGQLAVMVHKLMGFTDKFLDGYAEKWPDGGCPEGPTYWNVAAGKLIEFLELLHSRSAGRINIYDVPLVRDICLFISRVHLADRYFAAFADASPRPWLNQYALYRAGESLAADELKILALYTMRAPDDSTHEKLSPRRRNFSSVLRSICWIPDEVAPEKMIKSPEIWLPAIQIAVWRECAELNRGLVVAAKGGNNHEPHNHLDVGQFIMMHDTYPVIVDIGAPEYRRETFSRGRYDIFPINARAHNPPLINGSGQLPGEREICREAKDVNYVAGDGSASLTMELSSCYAQTAGLRSLRRTMRFERLPSTVFTVLDEYEMADAPPEIELPLYSGVPCELTAPGELALKAGDKTVLMQFDQNIMSAVISKLELSDPIVRMNWPGGLWRILLHHKARSAKGAYTLRFTVF